MSDIGDQARQRYYDDEISLVDLATTFIRRRRVFYVVFVLVMVAAVGFALLRGQTATTNYTTTLQLSALPSLDEVDSQGSSRKTAVDQVPTLIAKINSHWLPLAQQQLKKQDQRWPGAITAGAVDDTELVTLTTSGANLSEGQVSEAHKLLAGLIIGAQNERLAQRVALLEQQIETMDNILATHSPESLVAAQAIETRTELQQKVATGEPAAVLSLASKSTSTDNGPSLKLILALAIVLGLMLGIFAAFMAEFASQVRQAMKEKD
ncbi:hypothetical protein LG325_00925 [Marinobacter nauticus]